MIIEETKRKGFAFWCDLQGRIKTFIHDEFGIEQRLPQNKFLTSLVISTDFQKALNFLAALKQDSSSFGWELHISVDETPTLFYFAGSYIEDGYFIVASLSQSDTDKLYEELMQINNEQMNIFRRIQKENIQLRQQAVDNNLYEEISHINNELVNVQRELAKKNALLKEQKTLLKKQNKELNHYRRLLVKENKFINEIFGKVVDPRVRDHLLDGNISLGGEIKEATIFFIDIRNFTAISATMTPQQVVIWLNLFFEKMSDCIIKNQGLINKYMGDAILAVFGVPYHLNAHADAAINTVYQIRATIAQLNRTLSRSDKTPTFEIGIGIHTGEVLAGNIGSSYRMEYTVIGDAVNIASRVQTLCKTYKQDIIITEATFQQLSDKTSIRFLDKTSIRGKESMLNIYYVV